MDTTANPVSLAIALEQYQSRFLAAHNLAARTRREYLNDIAGILRFLHDKCFINDAPRVTRAQLEGYLAELDRRVFQGSTRRRKVSSIRSFFGFLADQGMTAADPTRSPRASDRLRCHG